MSKTTKERECGDCTICCQGWLRLEVHGSQVKPNHPCPNVSPKGCTTYESRPQKCAEFKCLWLLGKYALPEWMRPDNSKVILRGVSNANAMIGVPTGTKVPARALNFLKELCKKEKLALLHFERFKQDGLYTGDIKAQGYAPPGCEQEFNRIRNIVERLIM